MGAMQSLLHYGLKVWALMYRQRLAKMQRWGWEWGFDGDRSNNPCCLPY